MQKWRSKAADVEQSRRIRTSAAVNADNDTLTEEVSDTQVHLPGLTERRPTSRLKPEKAPECLANTNRKRELRIKLVWLGCSTAHSEKFKA